MTKIPGENSELISGGSVTVQCAICGGDFNKAEASRRTVCSDECKRERGLRYGRSYRMPREKVRALLLEPFGGRPPDFEDFLRMVRKAKDEKT